MRPLGGPEMADAISHLRDDPAAPDAEQHLADVLQALPELLLHFDDLPATDKVLYKTVAAPIFDPIGRVLLSLSVTGPEHPVPVDEVLEVGRPGGAVGGRRHPPGPGQECRTGEICGKELFAIAIHPCST